MMGSVFLIYLVIGDVLLCAFTFWVPCSDVRYDFRITSMLEPSLPPVVCRRTNFLFTLFVFVCVQWSPTHFVELQQVTYDEMHMHWWFNSWNKIRFWLNLIILSVIFKEICKVGSKLGLMDNFVLFVFALCNLCCQFLLTVHFPLPIRYSLTFI